MSAMRRFAQRCDRACFGPAPYRGAVGVVRALVAFAVIGYIASCLVDLAFGDTPGSRHDVGSALVFAAVATAAGTHRVRHPRPRDEA